MRTELLLFAAISHKDVGVKRFCIVGQGFNLCDAPNRRAAKHIVLTKAYWVGKFLVDLSRNQISHNQDVQTLPPKALQVLTYLAQNSGRVVSHDELLNQVWANTVVTPNTLQRSIAQLRKAFGETSHNIVLPPGAPHYPKLLPEFMPGSKGCSLPIGDNFLPCLNKAKYRS